MLDFFRRFLRKQRYGPSIIIVSGLPRSGTSMMMKMLDAGGLEIATDNIRTADEDNPKGYFELERVKDLDKDGDKDWLTNYRGRVVKVISFLLKDLPQSYHYNVLFMDRDLDEVIASQNKMLVRRGEPTDQANDDGMINHYRLHLRKTKYLLEEYPNYSTLRVNHRDVLERPEEQARRVCRFLGMKLDAGAMAGVVDPKLYRNRRQSNR